MGLRTETIEVSGIRCDRCIHRLRAALRGLDGLESANANLMGQLHLAWSEERLSRGEIVQALARAGFREREYATSAGRSPGS